MTKTLHQWRHLGDERFWGPKRQIFIKGLSEDKTQVEDAEQQKDIAQKRIEAHRGKSSKEAQEAAKNMEHSSNQKMQEIMKGWDTGLIKKAALLSTGIATLGLVNLGREKLKKHEIRNYIQERAQTKIAAVAEKSGLKAHEANLHGRSSLALAKQSAREATELRDNFNEQVRLKKEAQERLGKARGLLSRISESNVFQSSVNREIARMKQIADFADQIAKEQGSKFENRGEKVKRISTIVEDGIMFPITQRDPESAPIMRQKLKQAILQGNMVPFLHAMEEVGIVPGSVTFRSMQNNLKTLITGERSTFQRVDDFFNRFNTDEVKQYFVSQVLDSGIGAENLNQENDSVEDRVGRLKKVPIGQQLQVGEDKFYLLKSESSPSGFLLRSAKDKEVYAYINNEDPKRPVLTVEKKGEEGAYELPVGLDVGGTENTDTIDFSVKRLAVTSQTESSTDRGRNRIFGGTDDETAVGAIGRFLASEDSEDLGELFASSVGNATPEDN